MEVTVLENQSLFDICIQEKGSIEAVFALAILNNLSITDRLTPGTLLNAGTAILNKEVANYFQTKGLHPATGTDLIFSGGGIGYMGIEIDFIVS